MTSEQLFKEGRLDEALPQLQEEIRKAPSDPKLRTFLFQLLIINGTWDRAFNQLKVIGELSAEGQLMASVFKHLIRLESFRKEVFAGKRSPVLFGEPKPYQAKLVQALSSEPSQAQELRQAALEEAPAIGGTFNEKPFAWIMDADPRMGPVLEVVVEQTYYWMALEHVRSLKAQKPSDLRDMVWMPAELELVNGGQISAFLFVRYPGSEQSAEAGVRLSRQTVWEESAEGAQIGFGQRLLATEEDDQPLLELRELVFEQVDV
jgi:type VI secretion system protein ImpE